MGISEEMAYKAITLRKFDGFCGIFYSANDVLLVDSDHNVLHGFATDGAPLIGETTADLANFWTRDQGTPPLDLQRTAGEFPGIPFFAEDGSCALIIDDQQMIAIRGAHVQYGKIRWMNDVD